MSQYYTIPTFIVAILFFGNTIMCMLVLCCKCNIHITPNNDVPPESSNTAPNTPDSSIHSIENIDIEFGYLNESK